MCSVLSQRGSPLENTRRLLLLFLSSFLHALVEVVEKLSELGAFLGVAGRKSRLHTLGYGVGVAISPTWMAST